MIYPHTPHTCWWLSLSERSEFIQKITCLQLQITPPPNRSGKKVDNRVLYPLALEELGRVCKPTTSRAVLLTHDNKSLSKVLCKGLAGYSEFC